ncbi:MAG: hypothetical protein U0521_09050 [Anaerolineae bacterium]
MARPATLAGAGRYCPAADYLPEIVDEAYLARKLGVVSDEPRKALAGNYADEFRKMVEGSRDSFGGTLVLRSRSRQK